LEYQIGQKVELKNEFDIVPKKITNKSMIANPPLYQLDYDRWVSSKDIMPHVPGYHLVKLYGMNQDEAIRSRLTLQAARRFKMLERNILHHPHYVYLPRPTFEVGDYVKHVSPYYNSDGRPEPSNEVFRITEIRGDDDVLLIGSNNNYNSGSIYSLSKDVTQEEVTRYNQETEINAPRAARAASAAAARAAPRLKLFRDEELAIQKKEALVTIFKTRAELRKVYEMVILQRKRGFFSTDLEQRELGLQDKIKELHVNLAALVEASGDRELAKRIILDVDKTLTPEAILGERFTNFDTFFERLLDFMNEPDKLGKRKSRKGRGRKSKKGRGRKSRC